MLSGLSYQVYFTFFLGFFTRSGTDVIYIPVVSIHILRHATVGTVPSLFFVCSFKYCLSPTVHHAEYLDRMVTLCYRAEDIVLTIVVRCKRIREFYTTASLGCDQRTVCGST